MTGSSLVVAPGVSRRWLNENLLVVALVAVVVGLFAVGAARPLIAVGLIGFVFLAISSPLAAAGLVGAYVLFVPASNYGLAPGATARPYDLYYIGGTELDVSLIEMAVVALALAVGLRRATRAMAIQATWFPVWPALAFTLIYVLQLALAMARGIGPMAAFNYYSCRLVFDGLLASLLVIWLVHDRHRDQLTKLLISLLTARALYGLVRLAFFGGDPQNFYANYQHTGTAISFFDLADGAFLTFGTLYCIGRLARTRREGVLTAPGWLAFTILASTLVALTHRRSIVLGFGLALVAFFFLEGLWRKPGWLLVPLGAAAVGVYGLLQRFATSSLLKMLTVDSMGQAGDFSGSRFLETASAWSSVVHHPVLGLGLAGAYTPLPGFSTFAPTTLVHNSVLLLWLKLGLPGVFAVAWLLGSVGLRAWRVHLERREDPSWSLFRNAWLASGVVWLVDFLIGTPLIDHRHVLVMGIWLGMILVALRPRPAEGVRGEP